MGIANVWLMFVRGERVIYSASDLILAADCEYALLRELDFKLGRGVRVDPPPDEMLERAITLGEAHEARVLQSFISEFGIWDGASSGVAQIARPESHSPAQLRVRQEETVAALESGADVVFQATFFDERFVGFADFLVREAENSYTVFDTKLARQARVPALLQLAAYADQLERLGFDPGSEVALILGTMQESRHLVSDLLPVYRERRARLESLIDHHQATGLPVAWEGDHLACGRCPSCEEQLHATDDVLLVSGVRVSQRRKLLDAGIHTVADLARAPQRVAGMAQTTLDNLRAQAQLQRGDIGIDHGAVRIQMHTPAALGVLPAPDAGDVFFDFEGDPLYQDPDGSWNLEYLFGFIVHGDAGPKFDSFWADNRQAEGRAFDAFVAFIEERWAQYPQMHVYHYANYEKNALLKLAARHGRHEDTVDNWLRAGLFFDLYPVVTNALRSSAGSLGLKALEPLYMGDQLRGAEVASAADSVVAYAEYCTLLAGGQEERAAQLRADISDYNEYDCLSTLRLRDWLLEQARAEGVKRRVTMDELAADLTAEESEHAELVAALGARAQRAADAASDTGGGDPALAQAYALLANAVDYHRREAKPHWWAHFDRLSSPPDQWMSSSDVVLVDEIQCTADWEKPSPRHLPRRTLVITGALPEGSNLQAGSRVGLLYEDPPSCAKSSNTGHRGWIAGGEISSITTREDHMELVVFERLPRGGCEHAQLPMAIIPESPIQTTTLAASIREFVEPIASAESLELPAHPIADLLLRRPPRLRDNTALPAVPPGSNGYIAAIGQATKQLDDSYLAVQGPPGTGKTFVGARVIAHLVAAGWKIGVTAQSHEVIENLLREIISAGCPPDSVGKKAGNNSARTEVPWRTIDSRSVGNFFTEFDTVGAVLGGTAWDMVKLQTGELDLLVIDEAGQFTLGNTIAVSRAAQRLLLLGDPRQLPQVTQGTHGEPVDESALGWLLDGHETLPSEFGYFLEKTWRMHSEVCAAVSRHSYEQRLHAKPLTDRRELRGIAPGIHTVFVEHRGNATSSAEEAQEVVRQVGDALGKQWREGVGGSEDGGAGGAGRSGIDVDDFADGPWRRLEQQDVLVIAAYNAQVALLRHFLSEAGLGNVKVGTVDKLQGQQAPLVIVSMAASAIEDVPRGMDFLLSRNRINVAVSRAQWATIIVRSRALTDFLPASVAGLSALGAFIGLSQYSPKTSSAAL
ncbi:MAG TPA: TM0106 family RecB-like putative nuclease [Actinomycetales bacterium]|nr:TM0106 family RecB-like putative nuclease [Actinomycetales bacterium]